MTLPDPKSSAKEQHEFMRQWYYAAISNVSVHEVWPGHYLQFLYGKQFPSDIRKVFGANTNSEGWAHYCEQMVIDEGFHADDPRYRLAQIQDALLRDARFIVGIRMHTQGHDDGAGGGVLRQGGLSAAARGRLREQARHVRSDVRLLHDGQADDPEAARRLQGEDGRASTRCRSSTTRSSTSGRCRCRSSARRCSGRSDSCSRPRTARATASYKCCHDDATRWPR